MRRQTALIALIAAALTFSAALVARADVFAQTVEPTPPPTVLAPVTDPVAEAQALVDRAEQAQRQLRTMLFFEPAVSIPVIGILIVLTVILLGFAAFSSYNLRQLREEMIRKTSALSEANQRCDKLTDDIAKQKIAIDALTQRINIRSNGASRLGNDVNARIEEATRALSLMHFGTRQVDLGNRDLARKLFLEALQFDPTNEVINYLVGDLYLRAGLIDEGIGHLERATQSDSLPAAKATYAYALRLCGDREKTPAIKAGFYERAIETFLSVGKIDSKLLDINGESVFGALASLYRESGDFEKAREWYEHARMVTPQNSYPVNNLGILYYCKAGKTETDRSKACEYFNESRRKANIRVREAGTYWAYFDLITAEAVLERVLSEEIKEHISRMLELQPPENDLRKLKSALGKLCASSEADTQASMPIIRGVIDLIDGKQQPGSKLECAAKLL